MRAYRESFESVGEVEGWVSDLWAPDVRRLRRHEGGAAGAGSADPVLRPKLLGGGCQTVLHMKNITLSVPDDVYRATDGAAERGSSVSAIVSEYLRSLAGNEEFAKLEAQQHRIQRQIRRFRATDRVGRDEVHDRAIR